MKKLLLLAGILAASGVIFAADKALNEDQAEVKVTATVVASLIIKDVKNVDFGYLAAGTEKEYSSEGGFTIVGGSKCKVILEAKDGNSSDDFKAVTGTPIQVVMTNPNGVGNNAKMTSNLTLTLKNAPINNGSIKLGYASYDKETGKKAGEAVLKIDGRVKTIKSQDFGNYSGSLLVKAKYDNPLMDSGDMN